MQAPIKRKGSGSQPLDFNAKRARWEDDLLPPRSDSVPTASSSALISGVHTAQIYGGTFTVAGPGSINTTIHNHHYGPQILSVDVLKILNSLPLPNFRDIQLDTLAKATAGTCIWFTLGDMFLLWIEKGKILWGIGILAVKNNARGKFLTTTSNLPSVYSLPFGGFPWSWARWIDITWGFIF